MKIIKTDTLLEKKFSRYKSRDFVTNTNEIGTWEFIERTANTKAVVINAYHPEFMVLIKQFRVPMNCYCLEFPAGLVDPGEEVEVCAVRELLEETGFNGVVTSVSPLLCTSPGLANETVYLIEMEIVGSQQEQSLDESEDIEVVLFKRDIAKEELKKFQLENPSVVIDTKVWLAIK